MKNLTLFIAIIFTFTTYSQDNFEWQKIDSVNKSKSQIYTDTKIFIAETWKSPENVIQLDEKDAGVIILKGSSIQKVNHSFNEWTYVYRYQITFKMKEGKYNVTIGDVRCSKTYVIGQGNYDIAPIPPFEGSYDRYKGGGDNLSVGTLPEKKAVPMMKELKSELNLIFKSYIYHISKESDLDEDW